MNPPAAPLSFKEVLAIADVRRLVIAQLVSVFGDFLAIFAVLTVATYQFHANAIEISYLLVSFMLPLGIISPLAGVMVDRWNRKFTMIASDLLRALIALMLVFATSLWHVYIIFFCLSVVSAFFVPAQSVVLRSRVPPNGLVASNALMSQAMQVTQIVTPAFAGWLVASLGAQFCYWLDVCSFLFSALMVMAVPAPQIAEGRKLSGIAAEMTAGLRFIFTHAALTFVITAMTVGMFAVRCFGGLLAVYSRDILKAGPEAFGMLNSLIGIGMILGTQVITRAAKNRSKPALVVFGLITGSVFIAATGNIPGATAGMLGLGFGVAFIFVPAQTLLQELTPMEMLGRVMSTLMSSLALTQVIALLASGSAAEAIGIRNLYFASAAILAVLGLLGYRSLARAEAAAQTTSA